MEDGNGKQLEHRLTAMEINQGNLKEDVKSLQKNVENIMTNHLPHLKADVKSLSNLVKIVGSGICLAIIANIVINLIK